MRRKPDPAIVPLASKMFAEGLRIAEVCKRAHVSPQTWSRWAAGGVPKLDKLRDIDTAINEMIAEDTNT